ncbi:MAG: hypothetical protein HYU75_12250 [Betaproteobacteria bacterium]|nr:hypothetical protein [Betaproteobacteria bacterium]
MHGRIRLTRMPPGHALAASIAVGVMLGSIGIAHAQRSAPSSVPLTTIAPQRNLPTVQLGTIAQWQVPGIAGLVVAITSQQPTLFSGALPTLQGPNQQPAQVVGFRATPQKPFTIAVLLPAGFSLAAHVPALRVTPLADVVFDRAVMFLAPPGTGSAETQLPPQLAQTLGRNSVPLAEGTNFFTWPTLSGQVGAFLAQAGVPNISPPLTGKFDPAVLAAPAGTAPLTANFLPLLDLSIPLGNPRANWMPPFLALNNARLSIKGDKGSVVAAIAADVSISVGAGQPLVFAGTTLSRDSATGKLTLSGGPIKPPAGVLTLPVHIASLDVLNFVGTIEGSTRSFTLDGSGQVAGKSESFSVTLSGSGARADYAFSLGGTQSLAGLLGWQIPGLDDIQVSNITLGSGGPGATDASGNPGYTGGTFQLGKIPVNLFVFKPSSPGTPAPGASAPSGASGTSSLGALTLPSLHLPDLIPQLKGSPLDGLQISKPGLILAPSGLSFSALRLPAPVAAQTGSPSADARGGLNLKGQAMPSGATADLIRSIGLGGLLSKGLALSGSIDPRLLKSGSIGADIASAILASIDLTIPLGNPKPDWLDGYLALNNARLTIKGDKGTIVAAITADVSISVGAAQPLVFPGTTLSRDGATGKLTFSGGPIKPPSGILTLPAHIASLDVLNFAGTIDGSAKSFTLSGSGQVAGKSESFTVTLSGTGARAEYAFSLAGTQSLASLLGWQIPGLEDIQVSNITIGSGSAAGSGSAGSPAYTGGNIQIGSFQASLFVFKPSAAGSPSLAAITLPSLHLPDFLPQLKGSPLDGVQISKPGFIIAPSGFSASNLTLPAPVASHTGSSSTGVKGGLNLKGQAMPAGKMADLINAAGLSRLLAAGLPLTGSLDPRLR